MPTHYATLGLAPSARPEVIRAAYKALVLIYHPDRTTELPASERAYRSSVFRDIEEAFDVLGVRSRKEAYDHELAYRDGCVNENFSTLHRSDSTQNTPKRTSTVKLTTQEEKDAIKASARQQLGYLRKQREKRDDEEAHLDVEELKYIEQLWLGLADENSGDPATKAYCAIRAHEFQKKAEGYVVSASDTAMAAPNTEAKAFCLEMPPSPTPLSRPEARAKVEKAREVVARSQTRKAAKIHLEMAKKANIEQKQAQVRAEKEKMRAKIEKREREHAEQIAKTRAKVHAPLVVNAVGKMTWTPKDGEPLRNGANTLHEPMQADLRMRPKKACGKCNLQHANFGEWRKCNMQA